MCQLLGGNSQCRGGRYKLNYIYVAVLVPRSPQAPFPTACSRSVRIFKGRNQTCRLLIFLARMGNCSTPVTSRCLGGICCSCNLSSSSLLGRRGWAKPPCKKQCKSEVNPTAPWAEKGQKETSELEISGDFSGPAMVRGLPWRKHWFLRAGLWDWSCIGSPGIEMLLKSPELPVRAMFAPSITSKAFYMIFVLHLLT